MTFTVQASSSNGHFKQHIKHKYLQPRAARLMRIKKNFQKVAQAESKQIRKLMRDIKDDFTNYFDDIAETLENIDDEDMPQ